MHALRFNGDEEMLERFKEKIAEILDEERVITDPQDLEAYTRDYWPYLVIKEAKDILNSRRPSLALLPESEEEIESIIELASKEKITLIPYAGGSGVLGGVIEPSKDFVIVDLGRMNWINWFDRESSIVDVGPGVLLTELETWLNEQGKSLRHFPQSYPEAMLGGLVATRSIGQYSTGYGGIERMVRGLNIAIPSIGILKIPPAPRRSLLYPLRELFIGSEGTLGIITRIYLEALDLPEYKLGITWKCTDFSQSVSLAKTLTRKGIAPELFRIYDNIETQILFNINGSISFGIIEGVKDVVDAKIKAIDKIINSVGCKKTNNESLEEWLRSRFDVIKTIKDLYSVGLAFDTIEVSALWNYILEIHSAVTNHVQRIDGVYYVGTHSGHFYYSGAALYFTIVFDVSKIDDIYEKIWDKVLRITKKYKGSIAHHHGVGLHRTKWIPLEYGYEGIEVLNKIKKCLDPINVMRNPFDLILKRLE